MPIKYKLKLLAIILILGSAGLHGCKGKAPDPGDPRVAPSPELTTDKPSYKPYDPIVVGFKGFPGHPKDWITIMRATAPVNNYKELIFTDGQTSGQIIFEGLPAGKYEARGYYNWPKEGFNLKAKTEFMVREWPPLGRAAPLAQKPLQVRTHKKVYAPYEVIRVDYSGFPGHAEDWMTIVEFREPPEQSDEWHYLKGNREGSQFFEGLGPGNYEVRGYFGVPKDNFNIKVRHVFAVGGRKEDSDIIAKLKTSVFYGLVTWDETPHQAIQYEPDENKGHQVLVRAVSAESSGEFLKLTADIIDLPPSFFVSTSTKGKEYGSVIIRFFIDTDQNLQTGTSPPGVRNAEVPYLGYDFEAQVVLGYVSRPKGIKKGKPHWAGVMVDLDKEEVVDRATSFELYQLNRSRGRQILPPIYKEGSVAFRDLTRIQDNAVQIFIPLKVLGVQKNDVLRICYKKRSSDKPTVAELSVNKGLKL